jgi:hypothetical protein
MNNRQSTPHRQPARDDSAAYGAPPASGPSEITPVVHAEACAAIDGAFQDAWVWARGLAQCLANIEQAVDQACSAPPRRTRPEKKKRGE